MHGTGLRRIQHDFYWLFFHYLSQSPSDHFMVSFNPPTEWTALEIFLGGGGWGGGCRNRDFRERTQEPRIDLSVVK